MDKLVVVIITDDLGAIYNMALMYAYNSKVKGWWKEVEIIFWGPATVVLATTPALQAEMKKCMEAGLEVSACKKCAENYGVLEMVEPLGLNVYYIGEHLSELLKSGAKVLTV